MGTGWRIWAPGGDVAKHPKPVRMRNFGRNVDFRASRLVRPGSEEELLAILAESAGETIRVVGSGHSWSPAIQSSDTLLDMSAFKELAVEEHPDGPWVRAGSGTRIREILTYLAARGMTLPSIGLIAEQTVAGAIATGTHGSGRHSLSHYVKALRVASYSGEDGRPTIRRVDSGDELRAGRCAVGCLGVVTTVWIECVSQYLVEERAQWAESLEEVLEWEEESPLQQFYLMPETWRLLAQRRRVVQSRRRWAPLYRTYWLVLIDVALHLAIKLAAAVLRSRAAVRLLYRRIIPALVFPGWTCVDRSDRQLTMKHDLFKHLELELFVQRPQLADAMTLVREILHSTARVGVDISPTVRRLLDAADLTDEWASLRGTYQHHYPICVRRIRPDDTFISMASGDGRPSEDWYAVSLITYRRPRDPFYQVAHLLARAVHRQLGGRIHWGKWFPLGGHEVADSYPALSSFRACCDAADPQGVFRNEFVRRTLFEGGTSHPPQSVSGGPA